MSSNSSRPIAHISYGWIDGGRFGVRLPDNLVDPSAPLRVSAKPNRRFQVAQSPDKPLSRMRGAARDEAFVKIGEKLARVLGVWRRVTLLTGR